MRKVYLFVILALLFVGVCGIAQAESLRLPAVISDNMVLQQGMANPIWGWAEPGAAVSVIISGQTVRTTADLNGKWMVKLKKLKPTKQGEPITMAVSSNGETKTINNILVGEVWACSGQSNMEFPVGNVKDSKQVIKDANYPEIHFFITRFAAPSQPADDCQGQWVVCSPETISKYSAVGYLFGLDIHKNLRVPVGLLGFYVGGTPIESWTSLEMMKTEPAFASAIESYETAAAKYSKTMSDFKESLAKQGMPASNSLDDKGWELAAFDDSAWKTIPQPDYWENHGMNVDGVVWVRKTVDIPESWAGKAVTLNLACVDDQDVTYWNGVKVGDCINCSQVRNYTIPANLVKSGKTTIAVKITDIGGYGGIFGDAKSICVTCDGNEPITLAGDWKLKIAKLMAQGNQNIPSVLYNGMVAPNVPYGIRGALWYQGESNAGDGVDVYFQKMRGMINGWRKAWGQGDFPFLFVQLANYQDISNDPANGGWGPVRQDQFKVLTLKNTGMAVAIDLADPGKPGDIHPKDKQDVGHRLALWALANTYGKKIVYSGPLYKSMSVEGSKVRISFDCVGSGLAVGTVETKSGHGPFTELAGEKLGAFAIAGADRKWHWADAVIDGKTVLVSSSDVPNPLAVRYAYSMNPAGYRLYNKEGLPASPFTTHPNW